MIMGRKKMISYFQVDFSLVAVCLMMYNLMQEVENGY